MFGENAATANEGALLFLSYWRHISSSIIRSRYLHTAGQLTDPEQRREDSRPRCPCKGGSKSTVLPASKRPDKQHLIKLPTCQGPGLGTSSPSSRIHQQAVASCIPSGSVQPRASSHFLPLISVSGIYSVRAGSTPPCRQTGSVTRCEPHTLFGPSRRHPPFRQLQLELVKQE